jgi:HSP20 family protein
MTLPMLRGPALGRWDPLREFDELQDRMSRLMASVFGPTDGKSTMWTPFADVIETDDAYMVEVEVPGIKRDDVSVEVSGNELVVSGEFKERQREGVMRHRTRRMGRFEYRTTLPTNVDADKITADLSEGVLTVCLPKSAAAKPRRIAIGSG